jgi:hypothetical protein
MSYAKEQRRMGTQPYTITDYSKQQAKKLGVELQQSSNPKKKIDVYKAIPLAVGETKQRYEKIASIGAIEYQDYPTFMKTMGETYAKERRRLYKIRHNKTRKIVGSNSYWADKILW